MQPHEDVCESLAVPHANATSCTDALADAADKKDGVLGVDTCPDPQNHSQELSTLLRLCQASLDAVPENSKLQLPSGVSVSNWTKHFSLQDLTSASAGQSIFSPLSGPFPGHGPASYIGLSHENSLHAEDPLSGRILPLLADRSDSGAASCLKMSAVKRGREHFDVSTSLQKVNSDDAFMRRLAKIRHNVLSNSAKNDNPSSTSSGPPSSSGNSSSSGPTATPLNPPNVSSLNRPSVSTTLLPTAAHESLCTASPCHSPAVDVNVPSLCECGTVILGVWYRNRPYYARWFRHRRYAALRTALEQNRCRHADDPLPSTAASSVAQPFRPHNDIISDLSISRRQQAPAADASCSQTVAVENTACAVTQHEYCCVTCSERVLAPKFMSLLCLLQFVKHLDVAGSSDPSTSSVGLTPSQTAFENVKLSAHIDRERNKGFEQHRWYSADVDCLVKDLSFENKSAKQVVVGCCCLAHWRRQAPACDSSKSSAQLLLHAALDIQNVHSPFELESQHPDPQPSPVQAHATVVDWQQLDSAVWATCKSLLLLPADVIESSMKIPFDTDQHSRHPGSVLCGHHCDFQNGRIPSEERAKTTDIEDLQTQKTDIEDLQTQKTASDKVDELQLSAFNLQHVAEASTLESPTIVRSS